MAHPFANDGHGLRRFKMRMTVHQIEGAPWDSASIVANNTLTAPVSVVFVATNSPESNCSSAFVWKLNKSTASACKCKLSPKATPISSSAGEGHAPQAPGDDPISPETASLP